jgi:hypothetical protein
MHIILKMQNFFALSYYGPGHETGERAAEGFTGELTEKVPAEVFPLSRLHRVVTFFPAFDLNA